MMRKVFLTLLLMLSIQILPAQSLRELWIDMPDDMIPYLTREMRIDLVNYTEENPKPKVENSLERLTKLDTLTTQYLRIELSEASQLELRLLPHTDGDSLICMVQTYMGNKPESVISLYTQAWKAVDTKHIFDGKCINCVKKTLTERPDTMTQQRYDKLLSYLDPMLVQILLCADSDELVFIPSTPMLSHENEQQLMDILVQKKYKWDGKSFKLITN